MILPIVFNLVLCSCSTIPPLPPVDLSQPGWKVQQGQVIWTRNKTAAGIVGDVIVATNPDGRAFVQLIKNPLPFLTAQKATNGWSLDIPIESMNFAYKGKPPARIIWFELARHSAGEPLGSGWVWTDTDNGGWHLENPGTGESVEGSFNQ